MSSPSANHRQFWESTTSGYRVRGRHLQALAMMRQYHRGRGRLLDLGCGGGVGGALFRRELGFDEVHGVDVSEQSVAQARAAGIDAIQRNVDIENLPYVDDSFDAALCGEVIEHVIDVDRLLDELFRTLQPGGVAVLTTANLAGWHNRVALGIFGWQPFYSGVSYRYTVGHPRLGGQQVTHPSGRMRPCTLTALTELLRLHGFEVLEVRGWGYFRDADPGQPLLLRLAAFVDRVASRFPAIAGNLVVAVRKPGTDRAPVDRAL